MRAKGPIAAVQCTLRDIGWQPVSATAWKDVEGEWWVQKGTMVGTGQLVWAIKRAVKKQLWRKAT
eukprot:7984-Alexandrium_andersonii.AAC.1